MPFYAYHSQSTKSSKFLSCDNLILLCTDNTSQVFVIPHLGTHSDPAHGSEQIHSTGPSLVPREQHHQSPSIPMTFLNTSFHSDNFICIQWLYIFFGKVLFHLSILVLNHHLHFKSYYPVGHGITCLALDKLHSYSTPPK